MKPGKFAREAKKALFPIGSEERFRYGTCLYILSRHTSRTRLERYDWSSKKRARKRDVPVMRLIALMQAKSDQDRAGIADEIIEFDEQKNATQ